MRQSAKKFFTATLSLAALLGALTLLSFPAAAAEGTGSMIEKGKAVAEDRIKGNCLACHVMGDGTLPGNIGPPLIAMKARFPDKDKLRAQIWDATVANPDTIMIPFGRNRVLTEEEIDQVVEYVYTL
ncbi:MAG: sulfur oxidation c-type cytochrome SoxX [Gammaproteobacteria bacterium]|jgi:sulfur-oxidizing protein SoxX|nr:sulfur oxidation c-type cytochrome SoxX [Gammaproteobacteria bacterium]